MARAVARGIYEARPAPGDLLPAWREKFGNHPTTTKVESL
jgi:hypothetical protein